MTKWWEYKNLESGAPYDWSPASRNDHPDDQIDFHVDLGAGKIPKARLAIDRHGDADILMDLNTLWCYPSKKQTGLELYETNPKHHFYNKQLPFPDDSIESIISHHCLEHIGDGFIRLMDECYRVLKSGGKFRIIVPLFPSFSAVTDPDHVRYFTKDSFESFCHEAGPETPFWTDSFAEPYTKCRFKMTAKDYTPPTIYTPDHPVDIDTLFEQAREIRVTLQKP